jgi:hypothetical protein
LKPFLEKLYELKTVTGKRRILILNKFRISLNTFLTIYTWIGFILGRIDNELHNASEHLNKLELVEKGIIVSADELPPLRLHLINIDIISLIMFLNILMDDVTRFLDFLFIGKSKPQTKDFDKFKKTVSSFEGQQLEEMNRII